jgi:hypothetical protein
MRSLDYIKLHENAGTYQHSEERAVPWPEATSTPRVQASEEVVYESRK